VRGRPELELPIGERDRRRHRRVGHDVPGVVTAEHEDLALLAPPLLAAWATARAVMAPVRPCNARWLEASRLMTSS